MGMFGVPGMLWWAAAGIVPILIHLFTRQRYKRVAWAAMDLLERAFKRTRSRIRIENLLLLLLRVAALVLLALAAADPHLVGSVLPGGQDSRREVAIVLDDSFSMAVRQSSGETPFHQAQTQAERLIHGLRRERGDTVSLITAGRPARLLLARVTDLERAAAEVHRMEVSDGATDLVGALRTTLSVIDSAPRGAEVAIFTDLQATAFLGNDGPAGASGPTASAPAPIAPATAGTAAESRPTAGLLALFSELKAHGTVTTIVAPPTPETENVAITALGIAGKVAGVGIPTRFSATVRNFGRRSAGGLVQVQVDGAPAGIEAIPIDLLSPGASSIVDFRVAFREPGPHQVEARFVTDALETDNRRTLALLVQDRIRTLLVTGSPAPQPEDDDGYFFKTALELGAAGARPSLFITKTVNELAFEREDVTQFDFIALLNVRLLSPRQIQALEAYVARGGGLLIALGEHTDPAVMNDRLWNNGKGLLPATVGAIVGDTDRRQLAFELKATALDRPPFAYYADERVRAVLDAVPFYRFRSLTVTPGDDSVHVLAQFNSRAASLTAAGPAVVERRFGAGHVILVGTTLNLDWNELAVFPTFVPFAKEIAFHLVRRAADLENLMVGDGWRRELDHAVREVTVSRGGKQVSIIRPRPIPGRDGQEVQLESLDHAGIWRLDWADEPDPARKASAPTFLAVNPDPRESDLTRLSRETLLGSVPADTLRIVDSLDAAGEGSESAPSDNLWWWVAMTVLAVLVAEMIFAQLFGRAGRAGGVA